MKQLLLLLAPLATWAQFSCGTAAENFTSELQRRQRIESLQSAFQARESAGNGMMAIPVKPHLFANDDASGAADFTQLNDALAELNRRFSNIGIVFYFSGTEFDVIADSAYNDGSVSDVQTAQFHSENGVSDAINLYVAQTVKRNGEVVGGYAYLTPMWSTFNQIWVSTGQLNENKTSPHEFGHYFGLSHTFNNSDSNNTSQRELVTRNFNETAPRISANCDDSGDFICDTESDPYNVSEAAENCVYDGLETDLNNDLFHPQTNNIMDYRWCAPYAFTQGQYDRVATGAVLVSNANDFTLDAPETAQSSPENPISTTQEYSILVSWIDASQVETGFIVERAQNASGPFEAIGGVAANVASYVDLEGVAGVTYFYRIKPSNSASNYSAVTQGTQAPVCGNLNGQTCDVAPDAGSPEWNINRLRLLRGDDVLIDNAGSGCSEGGIGNFYEAFVAEISPTDELQFIARSLTGTGNTGYTVTGKAWVDWNQNWVFEEDELVYTGGPAFAQITGTFTVPDNLQEGSYRLRIGLSAGSYLEGCGVDFGELEDYQLKYTALGVADTASDKIEIYPNPAGDVLHIASGQTIVAVSVFDVSGKKIATVEPSEEINVSQLQTGLYFLQLTFDTGVKTVKFSKR